MRVILFGPTTVRKKFVIRAFVYFDKVSSGPPQELWPSACKPNICASK